MKAFIIEDEKIARESLCRTLAQLFPDISVAGTASSIDEAVTWLGSQDNHADIVFMDVELSDGKCFEIFRRTSVTAPVIMTTAYDSYAVKAFEVNSVDYLLKPIDPAALQRAVKRCKERFTDGSRPQLDIDRIVAALSGQSAAQTWKETFLVQYGDHLIPVQTSDIACIFSEDKSNHLVTLSGDVYMIDETLDTVMSSLNPERFFKVSRSAIVAKKAVGSLTKLFGSRLRIDLKLDAARQGQKTVHSLSPEVSRSHTDEFLAWLER